MRAVVPRPMTKPAPKGIGAISPSQAARGSGTLNPVAQDKEGVAIEEISNILQPQACRE